MNVYVSLLKPAEDELSISPVELVPKVVRFCQKNNIDKVVVERMPIITTNSKAAKPKTQVNIDAFVKMCVSRGIRAVSYTPVIQYPITDMHSFIRGQQSQAAAQVNQCRFTEGNTLIIATSAAIGVYRDAEDIDEKSTFFTSLTELGHQPIYVKEINHDSTRP